MLPMLGPSSARGIVSQYVGIFGGDIPNPLFYVGNVQVRAQFLAQPPSPPQADRLRVDRRVGQYTPMDLPFAAKPPYQVVPMASAVLLARPNCPCLLV